MVIYYGTKPWDGAKDLHGLLDIPKQLQPYKDLIENYKIHILEINKLNNFDIFSDDLKRVFGFLKFQSDQVKLKKYLEENQNLFQNVSEEDVEAIMVLADSEKLKKHIEQNRNKEGVNMCKAIKDWEIISEKKGKNLHLIEQVSKKIQKGKTIAEIAEELEEKEEKILEVYKEAEIKVKQIA